MSRHTASGLRANALAAIVMLLLEFCLGTGLYGAVPDSDAGLGTFSAFGAAVAHGPIMLTLHAILGTLLVASVISLLVRAAIARSVRFVVVSAVAAAATVTAWMSGAHVVGTSSDGAGLAMQLATALALLCCALVLFLAPHHAERPADSEERAVVHPTA